IIINMAVHLDCIKQTWRYEGVLGFYKGLQASLTRVIPACMITFLVYENVSHFLLQRSKEKSKRLENES
ncbi:hypothetical protein DOY81_013050, partial [Sarcophaga bullata]